MSEETQMKQFEGNTPLECRKQFEEWYENEGFVTVGTGGDHYYEVDSIWEHNGDLYTYTILYQVRFELNDNAM